MATRNAEPICDHLSDEARRAQRANLNDVRLGQLGGEMLTAALRDIFRPTLRMAITYVVGIGPEEQVIYVAARGVVTPMQHAQSRRYRPVNQLIDDAVNLDHPDAYADGPIPLPAPRAREYEALTLSFESHSTTLSD